MRGLSAGFQGNQSSATIATFPNVALYLDDQSMQFPARNVDIYTVDLERVEVLEGPQGTLFGGGAEAGAIRYITNKPNLDAFDGSAEASVWRHRRRRRRTTAPTSCINVPIVTDKLAVRAVVYDDHHGGYIDNVPSTFTRSNQDLGNTYFNIHAERGGHLPERPAGRRPARASAPCPGAPQAQQLRTSPGTNSNPVDLPGRASLEPLCRSTTTGTC